MTTSPPPPAGGYAPPPAQPMNPADEKLWATLIHLGGLFFGFLAPLIGYLVLRDRGPFVRAHTATALNFQLTLIIAYLVGGILTFFLIGVFVILAAYVLNIVFCIIAAVAANRGQWYTYPLSIPFVR
ncbi:DUF4870 domain-containing protein [Microbacterium sp. ET2]|uniref:DUF4870 domain-containing protein n=1 Tax=Microbacterium albipurpureum TaxID=3050384 RepID=UPI00259CE5B2|nr:DUF4870 domain-containing protein [Microbacterium sp. ET2 (Ac-2212)]WJL94504.1 DUF4870 domain-containing protein [Microbacterium sp. ET2 (Ac-2212)]